MVNLLLSASACIQDWTHYYRRAFTPSRCVVLTSHLVFRCFYIRNNTTIRDVESSLVGVNSPLATSNNVIYLQLLSERRVYVAGYVSPAISTCAENSEVDNMQKSFQNAF